MELESLRNMRIGVIGFGLEGQAVFRYLAKNKISATILDAKAQTEWDATATELIKQYNPDVITGPEYLDSLTDFTVIFRSPGVPRLHPKILEAESNGSIITSQTKWFFEHSASTIIGVTGTKGKGTTSSLIYKLLTATNNIAYLTGNIGKHQPLDFLDQTQSGNMVVYELSSFQLQDLLQSPHIGICLMTTSDHLDHHKNLEEYHEAKAAITKYQTSQDIAIYNIDYPASFAIGQLGDGEKLTISKADDSALSNRGAFISGDSIIIGEQIFDCTERKLRGAHNLENIAAACLVGVTLGIDSQIIKRVVNNFAGLEHRLQFVKEVSEVSYYNDSISTVPETTIAALNSFTQPTHLILGGSDKGLNYKKLVEDTVKRNNISSITILGEIGPNIHKLLLDHHTTIPLYGPFTDFTKAFENIVSLTKPGDIVLLSPASASFDMFKNYAARGQKFVDLVNNLEK